MKTSPKRGLMGSRFECQNGARSLAHKDHKAHEDRRRWTPADYRRELLDADDAQPRKRLTADEIAEDYSGLS